MGSNTNYKFFNRDISWLSFNYRVLTEAYDKTVPLYERIKFMAIFSNNLEEFYRVRVSYYRGLLRDLPSDHPKIKEVKPQKILKQINKVVSKQQAEFNKLFYEIIIPELRSKGIILMENPQKISKKQKEKLRSIFIQDIWTSIQPVLLVRKRIRPFLKTGHVYLVLELFVKNKTTKGVRPQYGLIKLPTDHDISRFIELEEEEGKHYIMFLEDAIMHNIDYFFPGYIVENWYTIKVTRDADLDYEDIEGEELIEIIENIETTRAIGSPNRFQFDSRMPEKILKFLMETFKIDSQILVLGGRTHNFRDFFGFPNPLSPQLERERFKPIRMRELENNTKIYQKIEKKDYLLHFPYQSFDSFISFLGQAAYDDTVEEICATQYRVASNSQVVEKLINAANNGKKVTVFVELKARFDEEANLRFARKMKQVGIRIIYSLPGVKVHAKIALITRREENTNKIKRLAFMGTGNFNEATARLYCDHGFFTADDEITEDVSKLFNYIENQTESPKFKHILVPNNNLIETFEACIKKEIKNAKAGKKGYILLKMNGFEDPYMISKIYKASEAGVKIDLIVRGICRVIPDQPYSKNVRIIRIVDRFLEHARVFTFHNNGKTKIYMGSADWMRRNLYRRIECIFPIYDKELKKELMDILNIQLNDNTKSRIINDKQENIRINNNLKPISAQKETYDYLVNKYISEN